MFVTIFSGPLRRISQRFVADPRPSGGSMFRIYRDTRFARDKSPYKTHIGLQFRHERAKDVHAPGFYLHLEPGNVFVGAGIWHPDTKTQRAIRQAIVDDPTGWKRATRGRKFGKTHALVGDSLKRPPRDFDAEHPLVEDLHCGAEHDPEGGRIRRLRRPGGRRLPDGRAADAVSLRGARAGVLGGRAGRPALCPAARLRPPAAPAAPPLTSGPREPILLRLDHRLMGGPATFNPVP